jgi:hypothetical protein
MQAFHRDDVTVHERSISTLEWMLGGGQCARRGPDRIGPRVGAMALPTTTRGVLQAEHDLVVHRGHHVRLFRELHHTPEIFRYCGYLEKTQEEGEEEAYWGGLVLYTMHFCFIVGLSAIQGVC